MKRNPKSNLGSLKSLQAKKTISKQSKSSTKSESVSKYFSRNPDVNTPIKNTEGSSTSSNITSLKEIQSITTNDENDFKTPKPVKKLASIFTKVANSKDSQTKRKTTRKPRTISQPNDKLKLRSTEVNEEHLQVALALSLSDRQKNVDDEEQCQVYPSTQQIRENAKRTLEQYGFKRNKSREDLNIATFDVNKRKKKSRYAHITPVLFLRSQEDREEIINKKVAAILNNSYIECEESYSNVLNVIHSTDLQKYQACRRIFNTNNLLLPEFNSYKFYLESLKISSSEFKCGSLLKKWEEIPGRELSPVKQESLECDNKKMYNTNNMESLNVNTRKYRSISLDLFDSDDELNIRPSSSGNNSNILNNSNLEGEQPINEFNRINSSPSNKSSDSLETKKSLLSGNNESKSNSDHSDLELIETCNGICHFESFCEDVSQKINAKNEDFENESEVIDLSQDDEKSFASKTSEEIESTNPTNVSSHVEIMEINGEMNISLTRSKLDDDFIDLSQDSSNSNLSSEARDTNHNENIQISNDVSKLCQELDNTILELSEKSIHLEDSPTQKDSAQILNKLNNSYENQVNSFKKHDSMSSIDSAASQDSIYISDEELNYSSVYCTPLKPKLKSKFEISDDELSNFDANEYVYEDNLATTEFETNNESSSDDFMNWVHETSKFSITNSPQKINNENISANGDHETSRLNILNTISPEKSYNVKKQGIEKCEREISLLNITNSPEKKNNENTPTRSEEITRMTNKIKHPRVVELSKQNTQFSQKSPSKLFGDSFGNLLEQTNIINLIENQLPNTSNENKEITQNTPEKQNQHVDPNVTPNGELVVKTKDVTPMPNYDAMNSPEIINELSKYGLKKLKRHRGVHLLKYLYDSTHPVLEHPRNTEDDGDTRIVKRRRKLIADDDYAPPHNLVQSKIVGDAVNFNESLEDMIFERKQSKRVVTCRLPLHIAWHNLLSANVELQENILLYEPLQVEVLYSMLKEQGFKYHIQDLITFLDKKCITIRINQGQGSQTRKKGSNIL